MQPLGVEISRALAARGVEVIFGIPGVHNVELYRGIIEAGITHILARHEGGAGFMADGYARASGKPGVIYIITGPGVTNALTPLGQAYSDSVPVLAVASCLDTADLDQGRGRLHDMISQLGAAQSVVELAGTGLDGPSTFELVDRALAGFATNRPRPALVQVPINVLGALAAEAPPPVAPPARPKASDADIATVAQLVENARKPLLILGGGARNAAAPLRELVTRQNLAVLPSYAGRGIIPDDHPNSFGAMVYGAPSAALIGSADLVIAIGTELGETDFGRATLGHRAPLVRVDLDARALADRHRASHPIRADANSFATQLNAALPNTGSTDWSTSAIARRRKAGRVAAETYPGLQPVIDALRKALPETATIFSDMTQIAYQAKVTWPMTAPNRWFHPSGFGCLGYALPAAIGGKVALGRAAPVIALAGDYGFQYTLQELATAVELGLNLPIILWDNARLKEIEDYMVQNQIAPNAVVAKNPDFIALARAYGANASQPETPADLSKAIETALGATTPTLIRLTPDFRP
ncbi:5-guanidino-2-oxopentanoate decarboxylase [Abyssibius alkaniclasticus]|uniref:5-guanidino-2-oxopentanoate decarboxylase n=1 Tax=Abyssibius alkaniclasticus TaxID=2881234 RepID=UPI0023640ADA|nr:5-guanidino-2-oxopentanoate decarboxylase [Abyssibius alkaniclasticus]UPH70060.1 5-guanidino-2-oxopentanoate decarboxylase [Abyssibius alkaniclasticus]